MRTRKEVDLGWFRFGFQSPVEDVEKEERL
jgi:hypothetical protein